MGNFIDLTGKRFERLLVLERASNKGKNTCWKCQCDCGKIKNIDARSLYERKTRSCGCLQSELASKKACLRFAKRSKNEIEMVTFKYYLPSCIRPPS